MIKKTFSKSKILLVFLLAVLIFSEACVEQNGETPGNGTDNGAENGKNGENDTDIQLDVLENFRLSIFADEISGARVITEEDAFGNRWVSRPTEGIISMLEINENNDVTNVSDVFRNLNRPHGLALDPGNNLILYYAESDKISKIPLYSDASPEKVMDLPNSGRHFTRTLHFGPDGRLYVSIGSSCDVCAEEDERRASVYVLNKDGTNIEKFADGLRNSVFLATHPVSGEIWATEMGRDFLGDNLPPDEVNILEKGKNYGWPYCYGKQIRDESFGNVPSGYCENTEPSQIDFQAHSAPLGLAFIPEQGWSGDMANDLLAAFHGSWNRSEPTGYKIVRVSLSDNGDFEEVNDFITGWLTKDGDVQGRPVDILLEPGGVGYITDDQKGVVYKLEYIGT